MASDYGSLPHAALPPRPRAHRTAGALAVFGLGLACTTLLLSGLSTSRSVVLSSASSSATEQDALKALRSSDRLLESSVPAAPRLSALHATDSTEDMVAAAVKKVEDRALGKALKAQKRAVQGLAETEGEEGSGGAQEEDEEEDGYKPMFYEHYKKGMLGVAATSKWVSADHPEGHKDCPLHDIDCDELWPWGKVHVKETEPTPLKGKLGDNKLGVFGEDDRVVRTEDSGLLPRVSVEHDHFDHWPAESKKNQDLLYGTMRGHVLDHESGVGDEYVPVHALETHHAAHKEKDFPLADLVFGSWEQGFHKPHEHAIRHHLSMFDQPYRQHMSAARGHGHVVYNDPHKSLGHSLGEGAGAAEASAAEAAGAEGGAGEGEREFTPDQKNGFIN